MAFWWYFILFFFPLTGGIVSLLVQTQKNQQLKLFLAFSGAFLLSITVLHLIPEVYEHGGHDAGFWVLIGFFFQIAIDQFSKGIEHGHLHFHPKQHRFPYPVFFALSMHALLEGIALGTNVLEGTLQENLVFGIALHEIPAAFALGTLFRMADLGRKATYLWITLYALMVPIGTVIGSVLYSADYLGDTLRYGIMGIVIGVFLHISTTILFENSEDHKFSRYKLTAIVAGIGIALLAGMH